MNVVRFVRADGAQRASVVVDPPALGRVTVELASGTSGVEASIKVASEQVRQLVQDQLTQLRMTLEQQGVQLAHFAVDVQQDEGRGQRDTGRDGRREGRRIEAAEDEPLEFRVDLEQGMLCWVA
ncbi:flagellar hook-length control protein FliK [Fretibacterium fastidiosum]|uniref:flagellar hook-length control protein FliK n=1 Tax=Fretibacterium fastidiosum TaxID=651822 RepID=UPI0002F0C9F7|nr:flagellar hook-length control protein FliK [Fretibacterium fastidiosum]